MSISITLDGADISAAALGTLSVQREERSAGIASFSYHVSGTPPLPDALVGKPVIIAWSGDTIYTGSVNKAEWDPSARVFAISCSDLLQESFEGQTDAQILALIPDSRYSRTVFGDREDGWQYALDCMSTVTRDVHNDRLGALQTPAYASKGTPDRTLTAAQILNDGEYSLDIFARRDLVTRQLITYTYRVDRWKQRTHAFSWVGMNASILGGGGWCEWYRSEKQFPVPTRDQVTSAANGTGWQISAVIDFETHPDTFGPSDGVCGGGSGWIVTEEAQQAQVISANWDGLRTFAQTITEEYSITLDVPPAQTAFGVATHEDSAAFEVESDDAGLEDGEPPDTSGWPTDAIGDKYEDQGDETTRDNDIQTLMAMGVVRAWQSLRGNSVTVSTPIMPTLELSETIEIDTPDINARGKVRRIEHRISQQGAVTTLALAISRGGAGAGDTLTTPARPDTQPTHGAPTSGTTIQTRVGGHHTVPDYDAAWAQQSNYVTNIYGYICVAPDCPTPEQIYPSPAFRVLGPDIETEAREEVQASSVIAYDISVPQDLLTLS